MLKERNFLSVLGADFKEEEECQVCPFLIISQNHSPITGLKVQESDIVSESKQDIFILHFYN